MQPDISFETGDNIAQTKGFLFNEVRKPNGYTYFIGNEKIVTGHIKQLSFHGSLFIEQMDYQFYHPVSKQCHTKIPFVELYYAVSLKGSYRYDGSDELSLVPGIHIYFNTGVPGELVFFPDMPIRGIRIIIFEEFYDSYLKQRYPNDDLCIGNLRQYNNQNHVNPALQFIFSQIKKSMESGIVSELYYESKIAELLYLITSENIHKTASAKNNIHILKSHDLLLVNSVKSIINKQLIDTPTISELAKRIHISPAKLQIDFQTAFGCTIHSYVQQVRMKEALWKLENTDETIYQIAKEVGCKNPSRFGEIFKYTFGVLPSQYRDLHRR